MEQAIFFRLCHIFFGIPTSLMNQKHLAKPGPGGKLKIGFLPDWFPAHQTRVPWDGIEVIPPLGVWIRIGLRIAQATVTGCCTQLSPSLIKSS
jgi:hypothetical protein